MSHHEEWRAFRDGFYDVSSLGNIRRAKPGISTFVGRPVRPIASAAGYAQVHLAHGRGSARHYVHRVVAEAFLGPCPDGHVVNHRDLNKQNNALSNLEYCTFRANVAHAVTLAPRHRGPTKPRRPLKGGPQRGDNHWTKRHPDRVARGELRNNKITSADVDTIRYLVKIGRPQKYAAAMFGLSKAEVCRIVRRERWQHLPEPKLVAISWPSWLRSVS